MFGKKLVGALANSVKQAAAKAPQSAIKPSSPAPMGVVGKVANAAAQAMRPPAQPPGAPPKMPPTPSQFKSMSQMAQMAPKIASSVSNAMRGMAGRRMKSGGKSKGSAKKSNW